MDLKSFTSGFLSRVAQGRAGRLPVAFGSRQNQADPAFRLDNKDPCFRISALLENGLTSAYYYMKDPSQRDAMFRDVCARMDKYPGVPIALSLMPRGHNGGASETLPMTRADWDLLANDPQAAFILDVAIIDGSVRKISERLAELRQTSGDVLDGNRPASKALAPGFVRDTPSLSWDEIVQKGGGYIECHPDNKNVPAPGAPVMAVYVRRVTPEVEERLGIKALLAQMPPCKYLDISSSLGLEGELNIDKAEEVMLYGLDNVTTVQAPNAREVRVWGGAFTSQVIAPNAKVVEVKDCATLTLLDTPAAQMIWAEDVPSLQSLPEVVRDRIESGECDFAGDEHLMQEPVGDVQRER